MRYVQHKAFVPPDDLDATIWRYVDFTKLVSLLDTESLFFARADTLGDAFEGSFSQATIEARAGKHQEHPEMLEVMPLAHEWFRVHTYVNCWNLDPHESAALWRLYVPPEGGVALKSTFRRLTGCFSPTIGDGASTSSQQLGNDAILIGRVRYVDYDRDLIPEGSYLEQFEYKRRSFEFEKEVRALVSMLPLTDQQEGNWVNVTISEEDLYSESLPRGELVKVDLDALIEAIHVSPIAPPWFSDLVRSVCGRYGLSKPIIQSSLSGTPLY